MLKGLQPHREARRSDGREHEEEVAEEAGHGESHLGGLVEDEWEDEDAGWLCVERWFGSGL